MTSEPNPGDSIFIPPRDGHIRDNPRDNQSVTRNEVWETSQSSMTENKTPALETTKIVIGGETCSYQRNSHIDMIEDIVISLNIPHPLSGAIITVEEFNEIILSHKVPVTTCLVAIMGLPSSGKTTLLEKVLRLNIKLKDSATWSFDDYMKRKRNDKCLSLYELCILGGPPHHQYAWSFTTKRYGAIFSILSSIVRTSKSFIDVKFEKPHTASTLVDEHLQWLLENTDYHLSKIKEEPDKITLLQDGLSLINVIDIGVNKALYDFLPIMMYFCRNLVRLAFLSLDRDGPNLHEPPELSSDIYGERKDDVVVMRRRSRLTYFLHFGTLGHQEDRMIDEKKKVSSSNTVVIDIKGIENNTEESAAAIEEIQKEAKSKGIEQFFKNWKHVDLSNLESLKELGDAIQDLIKLTRRYQKDLPLRWVVLRSLVVSLTVQGSTPMILDRKSIEDFAKGFKMDKEEVEDFLITFTNFGSILYIRQFDAIKDLVIVNIWQFTQYLDKLFYPADDLNDTSYGAFLTQYGLITKEYTKKMLKENQENFMQVITTFAMAAGVTTGNPVILPNRKTCFCDTDFYYLPSARVGTSYVPKDDEIDYAFLEIRSVNFPANVQAGISHEIMKNNETFMIATEESNVSRFEFRPKDGPIVRIEMIYEGSRTRLRIMNNTNDVLTSPATIIACSKVLVACCNCLLRKANLIRNLKYNVGIPCYTQNKANIEPAYHFIYSDDQSDVCEACRTDNPDNQFRLCWIKAAEMINSVRKDIDPDVKDKRDMLQRIDSFRIKQEYLDPSSDILYIAKELAEQDFNVDTLLATLNIELNEEEKNCHDKIRLAMTIILKWERSMKDKAYKSTLSELLNTNYPSIAKILYPKESIVY